MYPYLFNLYIFCSQLIYLIVLCESWTVHVPITIVPIFVQFVHILSTVDILNCVVWIMNCTCTVGEQEISFAITTVRDLYVVCLIWYDFDLILIKIGLTLFKTHLMYFKLNLISFEFELASWEFAFIFCAANLTNLTLCRVRCSHFILFIFRLHTSYPLCVGLQELKHILHYVHLCFKGLFSNRSE